MAPSRVNAGAEQPSEVWSQRLAMAQQSSSAAKGLDAARITPQFVEATMTLLCKLNTRNSNSSAKSNRKLITRSSGAT